MKIRAYLLIALLAFMVFVTGSDLFARMTVSGEGFRQAMNEHWASLSVAGSVLLFAPFGGAALICGIANRRARTRSAASIFCVALAALGCFYFVGFRDAQLALLEKKWTAAALSVGLLPFFVGIPLLALVGIAAAICANLDRRSIP